MPDITLADIYAARKRIAPIIVRTPLMRSFPLSERTDSEVFVKLENTQHTGAFKLRGAANKALSLDAASRERGIITVSSGNHGRAISYMAGQTGIKATVCLAENVPSNKVEGIRRYGAEIIQHGRSFDEAAAHAEDLAEERSLTFVSAFDDREIIAGQGTIGLEIIEDLPDIETIVVPLSGGGLLGGIGLAIKSANPAIRVIGVSMQRAPVMIESLKAGKPIDLPEEPTIADALVGGMGDNNRYSFKLCQQVIDETYTVSEDEIKAAMGFMLWQHHQVVEGGGAVAVAAMLAGKITDGGRTAVVVSGGNVDIPVLVEIAAGYGGG